MALKGTPYEFPLLWNARGKVSEVWTEDELLQLISEVNAYVKPLVVLQQYLEDSLKKCRCKKDVSKVLLTIDSTRAAKVQNILGGD